MENILDAGAGTQQYRKYCEHLNYTSQDFNKYNGVGNKKGLQTGEYLYGDTNLVCDISEIPIPNSCFDNVLCTEVLEHIPIHWMRLKNFLGF